MEALGNLGSKAKMAIPALVESCRNDDYYLVTIYLDSLRKIGPPALPAITGLLGDKRPEIRSYALYALEQMGTEAAPAAPTLVGLVKEGGDSSYGATSALAAIGPAAIPGLNGLLKDRDWYIRWTAAWTLRDMGQRAKTAAPALVPLLADENAMVREAAAEALGKVGATTTPALAALLKDRDASVRYVAARWLGKTDAEAKAIANDSVYVGRDAEHRARYARQSQDSWDSLMREAGEAKEGLVLEARPSDPSPSSGDQCGLIISLTNVGDLPFDAGWVCLDPLATALRGVGGAMCGPQPSVFIRNSKNEFVELSGEGIDEFNMMYGMCGSGGPGCLPPGWAWGEEVPIGRHFRLSKPGKYTILVAGTVGGLQLVAKPIILEVGKLPQSAPARQPAGGNALGEAGPATAQGKATDKEWSDLQGLADRPRRGFQLQAQTSSVAQKSDHLIISLYWAGPAINENDNRETTRATRLANYRLVVRDATGNDVPLTERGRAVFADKQPFYSYSVARPGEAWGLVCRLGELFAVKKGRDYKVLVVLPGIDGAADHWVAGPVSVHVPEAEVAGVTRPPYGSVKMWQRLTAMAAAPRTDLVLKSEVNWAAPLSVMIAWTSAVVYWL